jgi:hypothetical protein
LEELADATLDGKRKQHMEQSAASPLPFAVRAHSSLPCPHRCNAANAYRGWEHKTLTLYEGSYEPILRTGCSVMFLWSSGFRWIIRCVQFVS